MCYLPRVMYLLALCAVWLQGPSNGSPFTDAPLPFEQLKAPPDTAFDILMASLAMILLSAIAAGVFLGVSKLGAIEELLKRQSARLSSEAGEREERILKVLRDLKARDAGKDGGGGGAPGPPDWVAPALDKVIHSLNGLETAQKAGTSQLANTLAAMATQGRFSRSSGPSGSLGVEVSPDQEGGEEGVPDGEYSDATSSEVAPEAAITMTLQRVVRHLESEGFHSIRIVTSTDEMDAVFMHSGQLIVEARRDGVVHKGRVSLQNGYPAAVALQPSHSIFP